MPLNFLAVRLANPLIHPRVLNTSGGSLPGDMRIAFYTCLVGMALLFVTLWKYEMSAKHTRAQLRSLRRKLQSDDQAPVQGRSAAPRLNAS